jgi:hypothetical protein
MLKGKRPSADTARLMDIDIILRRARGERFGVHDAWPSTEANLHAAMTAAIARFGPPTVARPRT